MSSRLGGLVFILWSRFWISAVVSRRKFRNIKEVILETLQRVRIKHRFLFTIDGFEMYEWAVRRLFAGVCIYGQVIKKHRENRVVRMDPGQWLFIDREGGIDMPVQCLLLLITTFLVLRNRVD